MFELVAWCFFHEPVYDIDDFHQELTNQDITWKDNRDIQNDYIWDLIAGSCYE